MHGTLTLLPLRVRDLVFAVRGRRLIDGIGFELRPGTRTLIMGPNGAGKSLTLRLCHGLIRPSGGRVDWNCGPAGAAGRHAMVFQRPIMLRRSAKANLVHALSVSGCPRGERRIRAEGALARFGLADFADRPARVLSGGEQQRLAMARAWLMGPQVLFLDEPTAALDPAATRQVEEMIGTFHEEGMKIVMTTHDLGQARRLGDEVIFLHHGRLLEHTPAEEFFECPRSEEARAFLQGELLW